MNRALFLLLFFVFTLVAQTLDEHIKIIEGANQEEAKRSYMHIKNLYIQALMNNNDAQVNKLDGVLKKYKSKFEPDGQNTASPKDEAKKASKNDSGRLIILDAEFDGITLRLGLNGEAKESEIRHFTLHDTSKKVYRYVYDIKGVIAFKGRGFKIDGYEALKVAQFDKDVTRVVFYTKTPTKIELDTSDKGVLTFRVDGSEQQKKSGEATKGQQQTKHKTETSQVALATTIRKRTIVIDPGHGGKDCGTISAKGVCEKKIVLEIAKYLEKELTKMGYKAYLTRNRDLFIKLKDRTRTANERGADAFVSIHANSISDKKAAEETSGVETFFLSTARSERSKSVAALENKEDIEDLDYFTKEIYLDVLNSKRIIESNKLAIDIHKNILQSVSPMTSVVDNGVREGPFWVLVGAQMPSVLVEIGYLSHPKESEFLVQSKYQKLLAEGIAAGIDSYFQKLQQ